MKFLEHRDYLFPTTLEKVVERVHAVNPIAYGKTRNFVDGKVTYLSPYISRGIISTKFILTETFQRGYKPAQIEKFIQELAWRDYWQQVWIAKTDLINQDLKHTQTPVSNKLIPKAVVDANTGIEAVDSAIQGFYQNGYLHNHLRMYIASITCNMGQSHWLVPARWMYYYLLDADWASNALSWQWVAGSNANKKYVANQENINKYCLTNQKGTFLDIPYAKFADFEIPRELKDTVNLVLNTTLPAKKPISVNRSIPTCVYNFYNLDPMWKNDITANRILLLEPSHFDQYPVSKKSIDFILEFARLNISNIQVYVGEFNEFNAAYNLTDIYYKEHPFSSHYNGKKEPRDWMFSVEGYYTSFFAFWKKCKKQLKY